MQYRSVKGSGCVDGWFRWLRPGGVVSPFDVPFHVLAFDDARVGSVTACGVESTGESGEEGEPAATGDVRVVRGESRPDGRPIGV